MSLSKEEEKNESESDTQDVVLISNDQQLPFPMFLLNHIDYFKTISQREVKIRGDLSTFLYIYKCYDGDSVPTHPRTVDEASTKEMCKILRLRMFSILHHSYKMCNEKTIFVLAYDSLPIK